MKYVQILSAAEQCSRAMVKLQQLLHERASNAGIWTQGRKKKKYLIEILIWITLIASPLMIAVRYCTIIWPNRLGYIYFQNLTNLSFQVTLLIMWMDYFESNQIFKQDCWSGSKIYVESHSGFLLSPKTEISSQHTAAKEEPKAQISDKENTASIIYVWLLGTVLYSSFF